METVLIYGDDAERMKAIAKSIRLEGDKAQIRSMTVARRMMELERADKIVALGPFSREMNDFFLSMTALVDWPDAAAAPAPPPAPPPPAAAETPEPPKAEDAPVKTRRARKGAEPEGDQFDRMKLKDLRGYLDGMGHFYQPTATEDELRELARALG